ncbi:MAG: hypothetical protein E7399_00280 [Ruminococcaceae bacterium]|nr:hypothetical protein [Oscillospiraceae bacterium]
MKGFLTGNQLKIIALILMTVDHVGQELFPDQLIFRIIGRLAFPIFAYMIAEGCTYTKNKKRYLGLMAGLALVCQLVYFIVMDSLYQCVLVTFSLSICLIYLVDDTVKKRSGMGIVLLCLSLIGVFYLTELLPKILTGSTFRIDYDFWGVMLPVLIYLPKTKWGKLAMAALGLILLSLSFGSIQWYSLVSLLFLALYNGKRGPWKMKYLFYVYYPLHLIVIHLIVRCF